MPVAKGRVGLTLGGSGGKSRLLDVSMQMILVVEPDRSFAQRLADALGAAGWTVALAGDRAAAVGRMAEQQPSAVIVDIAVPEAEELLAACAAARGGPGSVAVVPAPLAAAVSADDYGADAIITKPFSDDQLHRALEACALMRKQRRPAATPAGENRSLSSAEIFGEILAEVESAPAPESAPGTMPGEPVRTPAPAPRQSAPPAIGNDLEQRLQQTLSGILDHRPRKASPRRHPGEDEPSKDLDDFLDRTLGPLAKVNRRRAAATVPAAAVPGSEVAEAAVPAGPPPVPPVPQACAEPLDGPSLAAGSGAQPVEAAAFPEMSALASELAEVSAGDPGDPWAEVPEAFELAEVPGLSEVSEASPAPDGSASSEVSVSTAEVSIVPEDLSAVPVIEPPPPLEMPAALETPPDPYRTQMLRTMPAAVPVKEGQAFGDYTLIERIAFGGMAEIWKARRRGVEGFEKTVAIKRVLAHLTDSPELVSMLIDEAKLAARLSHTNIVQIYDLGKVDDDFFIAMEYVDGTDLRSVLEAARKQRLQMPKGVALMIAARVARALDYAHRLKGSDQQVLGLVHRDVSPQNVLIGSEGEIKLCDFGIAKAVTSAGHTQMGALKGKPQYMSPEQAWGKKLDARSDIFSLGAVFFELLTGAKLFTGESEIGVLDAVRDCRITAPRSADPTVSPEAERIVLRMLAKVPGERYQSAGALAGDLEVLLASLPAQPTPSDLARYLAELRAAEEGSLAVETMTPEAPEATPPAPIASGERAPDIASVPLAAGAPVFPGAAGMMGVPPPAAETSEGAFEAVSERTGTRGGSLRWLIVAAIITVVILGSLWYIILRRPASDSMAEPAVAEPPVAGPPVAGPAATSPGESPGDAGGASSDEHGQTSLEPAAGRGAGPAVSSAGVAETKAAAPPGAPDLERLVSEELAKRTAAIEAKMRAEYDREQKRLATELAQAQARADALDETAPNETAPDETAPDESKAPDEPAEPPPSGGGGSPEASPGPR